jgi:hypothetical protein
MEYHISEEDFFGMDNAKVENLKRNPKKTPKKPSRNSESDSKTGKKRVNYHLSEDEVLRRLNLKVDATIQRKPTSKSTNPVVEKNKKQYKPVKSQESQIPAKKTVNIEKKPQKESKPTRTKPLASEKDKKSETKNSKTKTANPQPKKKNKEAKSDGDVDNSRDEIVEKSPEEKLDENVPENLNFEHVKRTTRKITSNVGHHFNDESTDDELLHHDEEFMAREEKIDFIHEHHDQLPHDAAHDEL